jgi:hypothetical protein
MIEPTELDEAKEPINAGPGVNGEPPIDECQKCGEPLPEGHHPMQRYCSEHQPKKKKTKSDDVPPRTVNVNIKAPTIRATKKGSDAELVKAGAEKMLGLLPLAFLMAGDQVCSETMQRQVPAIAAQLADLSEFHPGIKKIFAPAESTGEAMAWLGLAIAVAPVIVGILVHHNLVSPQLATTLAAVVSMAPTSVANASD